MALRILSKKKKKEGMALRVEQMGVERPAKFRKFCLPSSQTVFEIVKYILEILSSRFGVK